MLNRRFFRPWLFVSMAAAILTWVLFVGQEEDCSEQDEHPVSGSCLEELHKAAASGNVGAMLVYSRSLDQQGDHSNAMKWLASAASAPAKREEALREALRDALLACERGEAGFEPTRVRDWIADGASRDAALNYLVADFLLSPKCSVAGQSLAERLASAESIVGRLADCPISTFSNFARLAREQRYGANESVKIYIVNRVRACKAARMEQVGPGADYSVEDAILKDGFSAQPTR